MGTKVKNPHRQAGKGDKLTPRFITDKEYAENWDRIFNNKQENENVKK